MRQSIFLKDYTATLREAVKSGDISAYGEHDFKFDPECCFETNIERSGDLGEKLLQYTNPQDDYKAAKLLYEAFPNLTPEQASYDPFWAYLTHVDFYQYMVKRYCNGKKPTDKEIKNHWWHSNLMRRGLSNLWWSVKQTVHETKDNEDDKYHYTKYLFTHIDFRQRRLGTSALFRHKEAVIGILDYLENNVTEYFEGRANFIMMYFNKQATMKQLAVLKSDDFYKELESIASSINAVTKREEAADAVNNIDDSDWDSNE